MELNDCSWPVNIAEMVLINNLLALRQARQAGENPAVKIMHVMYVQKIVTKCAET